jgi:hypothetical protein
VKYDGSATVAPVGVIVMGTPLTPRSANSRSSGWVPSVADQKPPTFAVTFFRPPTTLL